MANYFLSKALESNANRIMTLVSNDQQKFNMVITVIKRYAFGTGNSSQAALDRINPTMLQDANLVPFIMLQSVVIGLMETAANMGDSWDTEDLDLMVRRAWLEGADQALDSFVAEMR